MKIPMEAKSKIARVFSSFSCFLKITGIKMTPSKMMQKNLEVYQASFKDFSKKEPTNQAVVSPKIIKQIIVKQVMFTRLFRALMKMAFLPTIMKPISNNEVGLFGNISCNNMQIFPDSNEINTNSKFSKIPRMNPRW